MHTGQPAVAADLLDRALRADPHHLMALTLRAESALALKDHVVALKLTAAVLGIEPNFAPALNLRSAALWLAGYQPDSVAAARRAMEIQPHNFEFRLRFAQFAAWTGLGEQTIAALRTMLDAVRPDPDHYAAAIAMLGELAIAEGRFRDALPHLDEALRLRPNLHASRMLRGMTLLRLGRFHEGWEDYAAREGVRQFYPDAGAPMADHVWRGQDLAEKTMLVTDDQGHGDAIQFFRYAAILRDRGAVSVTWRTFSPLVRLFAALAPAINVVAAVPPGAWFDFQAASTALPHACATTLGTIPAPVPCPRRLARPRGVPPRPTGRRPRVGLAWSGDVRHTRDHLRSMPAETLLVLTEVAGIGFHSLQHEIRVGDRAAVEAHPAIGRTIENSIDFADTAAIVARLDLVITVDTAVAHLAGALGKPVWLIVHAVPDWRWLIDRSDSPWYPTMRLFRVAPDERSAGWVPVIGRVKQALRAFVSQ